MCMCACAVGVYMLLRNSHRVNRLWRQSTDADRVLADERYLVFDEWCGMCMCMCMCDTSGTSSLTSGAA